MTTIDTNMSLVMIDPNEPLELYDGTIIKGRLEWFLYALCCLDYGNLPTPLSRIEEWANALITNELPNMEPQSRAEEFFKAILTGDTSNLPTPQSRSEVLLDKLARGENDFTNVEKIQSRYEFLLAYLIKNGGGIGNIDYVLYKFQKEDETLYNTKERPVKSAILSGQTLVNLAPKKIIEYTASSDWDGFNVLVQNSKNPNEHWRTLQDLKPSTKYYISCYVETFEDVNSRDYHLNNSNHNCLFVDFMKVNGVGHYQWISTTRSELTDEIFIALRCQNAYARGKIKIRDIMIIEYQDGMENWDIPYFEGMQSVKMPVLCTTGKNLFNAQTVSNSVTQGVSLTKSSDGTLALSGVPARSWGSHNLNSILRKDVKYTFQVFINGIKQTSKFRLWGYNTANSSEMVVNTITANSFTPRTDINLFLVWENFETNAQLDITNITIQIEEGSTATSYEPHKTNILSTPEDVALRAVGNVKDTLDCLTGELTQGIGEIVLNGQENWRMCTLSYQPTDTNYINYDLDVKGIRTSAPILCDTIKVRDWTISSTEINSRSIAVHSTNKFLRLCIEKSIAPDVESLKTYLSTNMAKVQYQLETPVIKTVDLTINDQGGATIPKLNTFDKITHVNVSATDILPEVEMEVATTVGEDLSGTLYSTMEDIETKQEALKESNNAQTESINSTMMATTEIYESLL
jgi:hypothetical protein